MQEAEKLIDFSCPECRGPMAQVRRGRLVEYRCLIGHAFSAQSILESHHETEERALWAATVALEEAANLVRAASSEFPPEIAARQMVQAEKKKQQASRIRGILQELEPFQLE